jgi:Carboxypeptidase regulatory-like domain
MTKQQVIKLTLLLFICVVIPQAPALYAQQLATLNVFVTDSSGSLVCGASVSLRNTDTGLQRTQFSSSSGLAVLAALTAGDYRLAVQESGFSTYQQPLTLTVGQIASISVQLRVAAVKHRYAHRLLHL